MGYIGIAGGLRSKQRTSAFIKGGFAYPSSKLKEQGTHAEALLLQVSEAVGKQLAGRSKSWLFPNYGEGHISSRQVQDILDGIAIRAGLQEVKRRDKAGKNRHRIHPYLLKHSFAIWSLDGGMPVGDLQDQLGHASPATTGIYLKASRNHRREATSELCVAGPPLSQPGHLMRRPARWSGLPSPPRCSCPACRPAPACHKTRRLGRLDRPRLLGAGPIQVRTGGWSPPRRSVLRPWPTIPCGISS
jgi:hypothetical protein